MSHQQRRGNKKHRDEPSSSSASGSGKGKKKKEKKTKVDDEDDIPRKYKEFINQVLYYNKGGEYYLSTGKIDGESLVQIFATQQNLNASQRAIVQRIDKDIRNNSLSGV